MKHNKNRCYFMVLTLIILLGSMFHKDAVMTVRAETKSAFSIDADLLRSDSETYDVRVTVENLGSDWAGTVRLTVNENYQTPCAFDTALSLPQGSKKQFVVKIPANSARGITGSVIVSLCTGDKVAAEKKFDRLLKGQMTALSMGILSDAYPELTYLDMGGRNLYFYYDYYPVKLVELQQGSLEDELDTLEFLVIDQYNTGILTEEELEAIEVWNINGGILILGTGAYAEDILSGFDDGYLEIEYIQIHAPGDEYADAYLSSTYNDMDMLQLTMAELQESDPVYSYGNSFYTDYFFGGMFESMGYGSVCVLSYSLTELGQMDDSFWGTVEPEDYVQGLLDNASSNASSRYSNSSNYYDDYSYYIKDMLGVMGASNSVLNFGLLKIIVVLYVIFVGPVLYLILRLLKRRELYWVAVPVSALLGIVLVFFAGRGFEVVSTKVYSVTMKNLSEDEKSISYLYCYDASRKEWSLKLAEGFEYAGPLGNTYYYSVFGDNKPYRYRIMKEGDILSLGMNPDSNFEDSYFYLGSTGKNDGVEGSLLMKNMSAGLSGLHGTIVNDTNKDMSYFAVMVDDSLSVYGGLSAGASLSLQDAELLYTTSDYYYSWYIYDFLQDYYADGEYGEVSALSALGVGIYDVYSHKHNGEFVVIGLVENWEKTVDDDCSEISYGCLYSVQ